MQGGKRNNSGRKAILDVEKKKGYKIYLADKISYDVEIHGIGNSFSEKCASLIQSQLIHKKEKDLHTVKIIDLFAGLGGIRLGFEQAFSELGYFTECVFTSEIKNYAVKSYMNYFGDKHVNGDITQISSSEIPDFDFLLAGFPCQPFSFAGKGLGFEDTRGTLFFEIERILSEKQPYGFLLENVEGLITHNGGKTMTIILNHLKKLGYCVSHGLLDSQNFGLAQSRKRIYIAGTLDSEINFNNFHKSSSCFGDVMQHGLPVINSKFTRNLFSHFNPNDVYGKSIKDKRGGSENIHSWDIELKGKTTQDQKDLMNIMLKERRKKKWAIEIGIKWMDGMPLTMEQIKTFYDKPNLKKMLDDLIEKGYLTLEHPKELINGLRIQNINKPKGYNIVAGKLSFEFSKILDPNSLAPTLVAMDVSKLGVIDNNGLRRLTIREGQRLCGYPENYDLSFLKEKEAFDLLGNTVCVPVIKAISLEIAKKYKEKKSPYIKLFTDSVKSIPV